MRTLLLLGVPEVALLAGSAATITLFSEIKAIDAKFRIIILSNGATCELAPGVDAGKLRPGDKVTIAYEHIGAHSVISKIKKGEIAVPAAPAGAAVAPHAALLRAIRARSNMTGKVLQPSR